MTISILILFIISTSNLPYTYLKPILNITNPKNITPNITLTGDAYEIIKVSTDYISRKTQNGAL
jgi:hypothetical protein